jgi:hypothetical protein
MHLHGWMGCRAQLVTAVLLKISTVSRQAVVPRSFRSLALKMTAGGATLYVAARLAMDLAEPPAASAAAGHLEGAPASFFTIPTQVGVFIKPTIFMGGVGPASAPGAGMQVSIMADALLVQLAALPTIVAAKRVNSAAVDKLQAFLAAPGGGVFVDGSNAWQMVADEVLPLVIAVPLRSKLPLESRAQLTLGVAEDHLLSPEAFSIALEAVERQVNDRTAALSRAAHAASQPKIPAIASIKLWFAQRRAQRAVNICTVESKEAECESLAAAAALRAELPSEQAATESPLDAQPAETSQLAAARQRVEAATLRAKTAAAALADAKASLLGATTSWAQSTTPPTKSRRLLLVLQVPAGADPMLARRTLAAAMRIAETSNIRVLVSTDLGLADIARVHGLVPPVIGA